MTEYTIETITAGESWACKFKVRTWVDKHGKPVSVKGLGIGEKVKDAEPGWYDGIGVIEKRDIDKRLVDLYDQAADRNWVVSWDDCWDVDRVKWVD